MSSQQKNQPVEIETDLVLYVFGAMLAYNFYNKYITNNLFKQETVSEPEISQPIFDTSLDFHK